MDVPWPQLIGAGSGWVVVGWYQWAFLTGKWVSKREADVYLERTAKAEKDAKDWQDFALRSLGVAERITEPVEVVAKVMTHLPDPGKREES